MNDFLGNPINPGDVIVYAQLLGHSAGLNVARIVEIETRTADGTQLKDARLLVNAVKDKWYKNEVETVKVRLLYPDRVIVISPDALLPSKYYHVLMCLDD